MFIPPVAVILTPVQKQHEGWKGFSASVKSAFQPFHGRVCQHSVRLGLQRRFFAGGICLIRPFPKRESVL
jgi:hypothetical protein